MTSTSFFSLRLLRQPWLKLILLSVLPVLYTVFFARFGWSQGDDGFILAYSWRIFNGEIPYRDFIYARPPLSPLLHATYFYFIPEQYIYLFSRFFVVIQVYIYSLMAATLLFHAAPTREHDERAKWYWAIAGFCLSVSAFTPMPWHTIDGILFAVLAVFFLCKIHELSVVLSALCLFASLLSKQSFYPLALLFPLLLLLERRFQHGLIFVLTLFICFAVIAAIPSSAQLWAEFRQMTAGLSTINDAIQAGIISYLKSPLRLIVCSSIVSAALLLVSRFRQNRLAPIHFFLALLLTATLLSGYLQVHYDDWLSHRKIGLLHILLLLNAVAIVRLYLRAELTQAIRLAALTAIAWCASISWGFQTPVLFATPLIIGSFDFIRNISTLNHRQIIVAQRWALACFFAIALVVVWQPYSEQARAQLRCDAGAVSPKMSHIITTDNNCAKLQEAESLAQRYRDRTIFLPSFDLAYFLFDRRNPLPMDWPMQAETANAEKRVYDALDQNVHFAIIDINAAQRNDAIGTDDRFYVALVPVIQQNWHHIESGSHYLVYANPAHELRR